MRSRAYPSNDLATAIRRLELYNTNLGTVGTHTRDEVAVAIGYKGMSGPASRAIAAMVHYGLLERRKDTYGLTELAKSILFPQSDGEREDGIREAAARPSLFNELIQNYQNREIPTLLGNILTSPKYGISPKVKDEVVEIFKATLEYAGLIQGNKLLPVGIHAAAQDSEALDQSTDDPRGREELAGSLAQAPQPTVAGLGGGVTRLPSGIEISFPAQLGFAVITGEFGLEIKALERKAQEFLTTDSDGKGPGNEDESNRSV